VRIFALSDIHVDYPENMAWVRALSAQDYVHDTLLLAGDVSHDFAKLEAALGYRVFIYWYPPLSIFFLQAINLIPGMLRSLMFWGMYVAGFGLQIWGASQYALPNARRILRFLFPLTMFFLHLCPATQY